MTPLTKILDQYTESLWYAKIVPSRINLRKSGFSHMMAKEAIS